MKYYKLHLLRHGLTEGNLKGLYIGSGSDLPLCDEGRAQLKTLKKDFDYPQVPLVFTSTLTRATETAEILFPGVRQIELDDLREMAFGKFEGRAVQELVKDPVIMNMLSQHALPFRKPEEWMTDPGAGYSVRLDAEMWMRDHLAEAYDVVPHGYLDGME